MDKKKRSGFAVMCGLIGMVKPLAGFMTIAVIMGIIGHLMAIFITVFGAMAVLIELLEVFYAHTISPVIIAFFVSLIMCVFLAHINPVLAVVALVAYVAVGVCVPVYISKASKDTGLTFRTKSGELSSFVLDSLRGLPEILQYNCGMKRLDEMNRRTDSLSEDESRLKSLTGINMAVTNTVILVADLVMIIVSCSLYGKGAVSFAGILVSVVAMMSSFGPVVALANLGSTLQNTFAAGNRVLDILDEQPVTKDVTGCENIEFNGAAAENVTFSYGEETILSDVSIPVPKGSIIGISGRSGSGKSTLLKLFMRFWSTDKGTITISDKSVEQINTDNLRSMESFVTQDTHLFNDTIKNNVRIAKLDATDEEIIEACKKASVHDFISKLPDGYDTNVGELGDMLSGGEKQRIGLARAFLHDAPFVLLDEPTSNLDSLNEAIILKSLKEEGRGRTVALVSHRQSTMRIADKVYCVENGRVS